MTDDALRRRADELELRVEELERTARLRELWETEIAGRRSASVLVDPDGQVIAARGAGSLPESVDLPPDYGDLVQMPDGRMFGTQWLGGHGAILWLRRRRASVVRCICDCLAWAPKHGWVPDAPNRGCGRLSYSRYSRCTATG
jgi:hypothetical protein